MLKKIFLISFLILISLPSFSAETTVPSEKIKIDFHLNTKAADKNNHLKIKTDSVKHSDFFDAVSGASKNHSTRETRNIFFENTSKQFLCPKGLRSLLLFASSSPDFLANDNFIAKNENGIITITFSHRGTDFKITSDRNGTIFSPEGFQLLKKDESQAQDSQDKEPIFVQDFSAESPKFYKGKLKSSLSPEGILRISGTLVLTETPPQTASPQETQENLPAEDTKKIDESQIDS